MKRNLFLYFPNGSTKQYTTVDMGDTNYQQVNEIIPLIVMLAVQVVESDGNRITYTGIPYEIHEWDY